MQSRTTTTLVPFEEDDDDFLYHTNINEMRSPMYVNPFSPEFTSEPFLPPSPPPSPLAVGPGASVAMQCVLPSGQTVPVHTSTSIRCGGYSGSITLAPEMLLRTAVAATAAAAGAVDVLSVRAGVAGGSSTLGCILTVRDLNTRTLADLCAAFLKKAPSQSSGARLQQQHLVLSIETSYLEHRSVLHQGPLRQGDSLQQGSFQSDSLQHSSYQQDSFHQASFQRGSHSAAKTGCAALPSHPRTVLEAYEDDFDVVVA